MIVERKKNDLLSSSHPYLPTLLCHSFHSFFFFFVSLTSARPPIIIFLFNFILFQPRFFDLWKYKISFFKPFEPVLSSFVILRPRFHCFFFLEQKLFGQLRSFGIKSDFFFPLSPFHLFNPYETRFFYNFFFFYFFVLNQSYSQVYIDTTKALTVSKELNFTKVKSWHAVGKIIHFALKFQDRKLAHYSL